MMLEGMCEESVVASLNVLKEHTKRSILIIVTRLTFKPDHDIIRSSMLQTKAGSNPGTNFPIFERDADTVPIGHDAVLFYPSTSANYSLRPHSPSHV
jgi:hypothetical protein